MRENSPSEVLCHLILADKIIQAGLATLKANEFTRIIHIDNENSNFSQDAFLESFTTNSLLTFD